MKAPRVIIYVDERDWKLDLADVTVESGVILEVRQVIHEDNTISTDPVVIEKRSDGSIWHVDTRIEA